MERTPNSTIELLVEQLAAALEHPVELYKCSSGDGWTRYSLSADGDTIGRGVMTRSELEASLRMTLSALHIADNILFGARMSEYWQRKNA